jgi:hypothetical protein
MKVVFLDFDGVLLPFDPAAGMQRGEEFKISKDAVTNLNIITQLASAQIAVISSWRKEKTDRQLSALLNSWGVLGTFIGATPCLRDDRGTEISMFLQNYNKITSFVILDDEPTDLELFAKNIIHVRSQIGLSFVDAEKAIKILAGD